MPAISVSQNAFFSAFDQLPMKSVNKYFIGYFNRIINTPNFFPGSFGACNSIIMSCRLDRYNRSHLSTFIVPPEYAPLATEVRPRGQKTLYDFISPRHQSDCGETLTLSSCSQFVYDQIYSVGSYSFSCRTTLFFRRQSSAECIAREIFLLYINRIAVELVVLHVMLIPQALNIYGTSRK